MDYLARVFPYRRKASAISVVGGQICQSEIWIQSSPHSAYACLSSRDAAKPETWQTDRPNVHLCKTFNLFFLFLLILIKS